MHGEMNAFAETANFETRNVLFEDKAMNPAMPAMSAKPQNVYAWKSKNDLVFLVCKG